MRPLDHPTLMLSDAERVTLEKWSRQRTGPAARVLRARIVLDCAAGLRISEVRGRQRVSEATVRKWRRRFETHGLDGLRDDRRSGRPRTLTDIVAVEILTHTVRSHPPDGRPRWTTRTLAEAVGVSQTAVSRVWRNAGLTVGAVRTCRAFAATEALPALDDLVGTYAHPARAAFAFASGVHEAAGSPRGGQGLRDVGSASASSFTAFLRHVDKGTPPGVSIRLLLWEASPGRDAEMSAWLERHSRVDVWPIPAPAWWGRLLVPDCSARSAAGQRRFDWDKASREFAEIIDRGATSAVARISWSN